MARRGLVVSYYFPPAGGGGVQRWVKFIKYLTDLDWRFTVITSRPESNQPIDNSLVLDIPEETRVIRIDNQEPSSKYKYLSSRLVKSGYWQRWLSAFFNITDSRHQWNDRVKKVITEEVSKHHYDFLIISAPPYSLAELAAELEQRLPMPVVFDLRDPWTINPYKIHPTTIHRYLDRRREYRTINRISSIISAYHSTFKDYAERIPSFKKKKILYLPNGYDEQDFLDLKPVTLKDHADFRIGFSGSVYSHLNTPDLLFAALGELKSKGLRVEFHHVGTSVYNLKKIAASFGIEENVIEWGYRSHRECLAVLTQMDALCLVLDERCKHSGHTIGGKFYEYLRLKKPIFALVPEEGEAADMIRETDSGIVIGGQDTGRISAQLLNLIQKKITFTWLDIEKYNRKKQALVLNNFLESLNDHQIE